MLSIQNLGPIQSANVRFGDLTVLVGPQATGKSIFLQTAKLLLDARPIQNEFQRFNIDWSKDPDSFLELYFGSGMASIWSPDTRLMLDQKPVESLKIFLSRARSESERVFYIPAQRVLSLREGLTRPFTDYRSGDPFVLREFSEKLHFLVQSEFSSSATLFPQDRRLKKDFRELLVKNIFAGFNLEVDAERFQKRIVLAGKDTTLPYLVWSAGQREFVPLLLGLYWLMPPSKTPRRKNLDWVIIEEPEMGLHPDAISATLAMVFGLLWRGYRVCISTHSPHVLDVVWALRVLQEYSGTEKDVLRIFGLPVNQPTRDIAETALKKTTKVYFFRRDETVVDISQLDPGAESPDESGWGGLSGFSGNVADIVAEVVNRRHSQSQESD